jgi:hypothetical protein
MAGTGGIAGVQGRQGRPGVRPEPLYCQTLRKRLRLGNLGHTGRRQEAFGDAAEHSVALIGRQVDWSSFAGDSAARRPKVPALCERPEAQGGRQLRECCLDVVLWMPWRVIGASKNAPVED